MGAMRSGSKVFARVLGALVGGAVVAVSAACVGPALSPAPGMVTGRTAIATDGTKFDSDGREDRSLYAIAASGQHDLSCPVVQPAWLSHADYMAEGCGQRALYRLEYWVAESAAAPATGHVLLLSRFTLGDGGSPVNTSAGCAKDVDCKGARICVKGDCVDP